MVILCKATPGQQSRSFWNWNLVELEDNVEETSMKGLSINCPAHANCWRWSVTHTKFPELFFLYQNVVEFLMEADESHCEPEVYVYDSARETDLLWNISNGCKTTVQWSNVGQGKQISRLQVATSSETITVPRHDNSHSIFSGAFLRAYRHSLSAKVAGNRHPVKTMKVIYN